MDEPLARIQQVIDALLAYEREVNRQVVELAERARNAEWELQQQTESSATAALLVEEARERAAEITDRASEEAQELLRRARAEARELLIESRERERELIGALREYLGQVEGAQSTLLRIARRSLSALIADTEQDACPPSPAPSVGDTAPDAGANEHVESPAQSYLPPDRPAVNDPSAQGAPSISEPSIDDSGTTGLDLPPAESPHEGSAWAVSASATRSQDQIDVRNRLDLERLDREGGRVTRVLSRRRSDGLSQ